MTNDFHFHYSKNEIRVLFTELVFPEEAQDTPQPGTADPELDGFLPVADPSTLQSVTLLDNAENFFEGEEIADKPPTGLTKRKRAVINPVKWTSQEEVELNTKFRKYIEKGDRPSPRKIRKLVPSSLSDRSFSAIKNKIYRMISNRK